MSAHEDSERSRGLLIPVASLLGRLLVREVDPPLLEQMRQPEMAEALGALGLQLPVDIPDDQLLESLAVDYCASFVVPPEPLPLVQSLWEQGGYEGEPARALRALADAADLEYSRDRARAAPPDHLGCILHLWASIADSWPEARHYLAERHLLWAEKPLRQLACRSGFYARLAPVLLDLLEEIRLASSL